MESFQEKLLLHSMRTLLSQPDITTWSETFPRIGEIFPNPSEIGPKQREDVFSK